MMTKKATTKTPRYAELKRMLEVRRCELVDEINRSKRVARTNDKVDVRDVFEVVADETQEDVILALMQMKAETRSKIDEALGRLELGTYGICSDCGGEISEARLSALMFASRCKDCENAWESAENRQRNKTRNVAFVSDDLFHDD